jgi:hypothetical protein
MLRDFLQKNKKILGLIFLVIIILGPFYIHTANAAWCLLKGTCMADAFSRVMSALLVFVLWLPIKISGWILFVSGYFLNTVLDYTVTNATEGIKGISGINIAWSTIRDVANMSFIFILLYIAISTILGLSGSQWKKTLVNVVIAAILINFSMFFTKIIIDASNVVTLGFYRQIIPAGSVTKGLSDSIMQPLGLSTLYNGSNATLDTITEPLKVAIISIGGSFFMIATAFTFIAVSVMFLVRYVTIIFLIVLSPLAFMGYALPQIASHTAKWWKQLFGQAIFAPLYMLMLWVVLTIIGGGGFVCVGAGGKPIDNFAGMFDGIVQGTTNSGGVLSGSCPAGPISMVLNYVIIISFVLGALTIAKQTSEQAGGAAQKIVGGALGLGVGATALAGRQTIGRFVGGSLAKSENARVAQIGNRLRAGSFDIRSPLNAASGAMGFDNVAGSAGGKGGVVASDKAFRETMGMKGSTTAKAAQAQASQNRDVGSIKRGLAAKAAGAPDNHPDVVAMNNSINNMSNKETTDLVAKNRDYLKNPEFVSRLSSQQLAAVHDSDDTSAPEKAALVNARFSGINSAVGAIPAGGVLPPGPDKDAVANLSEKELDLLDPTVVSNPAFVGALKHSQFEYITTKSQKFTTAQKAAMKTQRVVQNTSAVTSDPNAILSMNAKDVANLNDADIAGARSVFTEKFLIRLGAELNPTKTAAVKLAINTDPTLVTLATWMASPDGVKSF